MLVLYALYANYSYVTKASFELQSLLQHLHVVVDLKRISIEMKSNPLLDDIKTTEIFTMIN